MRKRYGRNLRAGQWKFWTREWFEAQGLVSPARHHPLPGNRVVSTKKIIGKPCAGKPHARIERGMGNQTRRRRALRP